MHLISYSMSSVQPIFFLSKLQIQFKKVMLFLRVVINIICPI